MEQPPPNDYTPGPEPPSAALLLSTFGTRVAAVLECYAESKVAALTQGLRNAGDDGAVLDKVRVLFTKQGEYTVVLSAVDVPLEAHALVAALGWKIDESKPSMFPPAATPDAEADATEVDPPAQALGRYIFVPASFYPDAASELRDTAGFIGRIIGKAATRAKDPVA